jgi:hypothetical protein
VDKRGKRNTFKKVKKRRMERCNLYVYYTVLFWPWQDGAARVRPHSLPLLEQDTGLSRSQRPAGKCGSPPHSTPTAPRIGRGRNQHLSSNSGGTDTGSVYYCHILPSISQSSSRSRQLCTMSEERSKISLRSGKRKGRPSIKISGPILQQDAGSRGPPGRPAAADVPPPRPRPPPQSSATVSLHA